MRRLVLAALLIGAVWAQDDKKETAVARGRKVFLDTQDDDYPSCADCHNVVPEEKEAKEAKYLGPGVTLYGAARRAGWRNRDTFENVAEASQYCAKTWQERKNGLKAAQRADLLAYLQSIAGKKALPKRKVKTKPKLLREIGGGDAEAGKKTSIRYCGKCHNADGLSFDLEPGKKKKDLVARKVRGYNAKRKFKPQKGTMSYYTVERLSDKDLRDIIAYLGK
ncbi:MAG: c-type cytochrome [Planctomycetota bacterium]|jgi:mono/diheme cytochrome c family protein